MIINKHYVPKYYTQYIAIIRRMLYNCTNKVDINDEIDNSK